MTAEAARELEQRATVLLKAFVAGSAVPSPASRAPGEEQNVFSGTGGLEPPYDLHALCRLFEHSNSLRQNVDAYATNIDAFGYRFEPVIDFDAADAREKVREALRLERLAAAPLLEPSAIDDAAIDAKTSELGAAARTEKARLESFFEFCCSEQSFVSLRRRTRQDLEVTGNAYWEVLRDGKGDVARFVYVPACTVRLMPLELEPVELDERIRVSPITFEKIRTRRRLRRFVQVQGSDRVYFKALGDPRLVSRRTGRTARDQEELRFSYPGDGPATELIHFAIPSPRSPYGVPRWIGTLISVLGSREMEEVNYLYFGNKSVPPLALLVSGGRLGEASVPRIERFIEENLRGKANFHRILILEAEGTGAGDTGSAKIELRPLTDAQQKDALFSEYDTRNIDKVGSAFRLPPLLRGDGRGMNRSVADAQLRFAEDQVFQPERDELDFFVNRCILAELGIRFWRFKTQTLATRDPERMADMVEKMVRVGVLTPEEGRVLAGDIFNHEFQKISDDWTKRPITLTLAGIQTGVQDVRDGRARGDLVQDAKRLLSLREELKAEEERLVERRMALARQYIEPERVHIPREEFESWFEERGP
ncbi:MAG: phage portal protein [Pseudomonadota bacterium]